MKESAKGRFFENLRCKVDENILFLYESFVGCKHTPEVINTYNYLYKNLPMNMFMSLEYSPYKVELPHLYCIICSQI